MLPIDGEQAKFALRLRLMYDVAHANITREEFVEAMVATGIELQVALRLCDKLTEHFRVID